jgi:hypothetical protein
MSYAFLSDCVTKIQETFPEYYQESPETIKKGFGPIFKDLQERYNDPSAVGKFLCFLNGKR